MKVALFAAILSCVVGFGVSSAKAAPLCYVHFRAAGWTFNGTVGRSSRTSCPFANAVDKKATAFLIHHGGGYSWPFTVRAWSPVTYRWYRMQCVSRGNLFRSQATFRCRGGIGAAVYSTVWINR